MLDGETTTSVIVDSRRGENYTPGEDLTIKLEMDGQAPVIALEQWQTSGDGWLADDDGPSFAGDVWRYTHYSSGTGTPWSSLFIRVGDDLIAFNGITGIEIAQATPGHDDLIF